MSAYDPATPAESVDRTSPLFLYIPAERLIFMSIFSFGIYEVYWMYKNWCYVRDRDQWRIRPFWRAFFGVFYVHGLLRRMHEDKDAAAIDAPSFSPQNLATVWIVLRFLGNVIGRMPGLAATIVGALVPTYLCLVPVQNYVNGVAAQRNPGQRYYKWSTGHIVCLVVGLLFWCVLLFLPDTQE